MKVKLEVEPKLATLMAAEIAAGEKAVKRAAIGAGVDLKTAWRRQITGAGLGNRLARTIREQAYPKGQNSLNAAAYVWSNAPEIVDAHDRGTTIRSDAGFFLAIPTEAAGRGSRGARLTPGEWEQRRGMALRFVYRKSGPSLLVAEGRVSSKGRAVQSRSKTGRGRATVPIFILVPQVKLRKRLDLDRDVERGQNDMPGRIVDAWVSDKVGE